MKQGLAGRLAALFLDLELTPLLAVVGVLLGVFAVVVTPKEEEPQIAVTFANVFIPFPGASAKEVESLVTTPAEQIIREIEGVEHVYSASAPGLSAITVRYRVGEPRTEAIVRLYNAFYSNQDWLPPDVGVGAPLIKPKGIDDVPILALTLWSKASHLNGGDLRRIAETISSHLQRVDGTRDIEVIGPSTQHVLVQFDPQRLANYGLDLRDLTTALRLANESVDAGHHIRDEQSVLVQAGTFLNSAEQVADLVVGVRQGAPVFLRDVATIRNGEERAQKYVSFGLAGSAAAAGPHMAVTISVSKKPGENAVEVAENLLHAVAKMKNLVLPQEVEVAVTRNYGATAADKSNTLIQKLFFATISVVLLVALTLGLRESLVVGSAVIVTLALTLFASWAWGFTINRVSLFALIFSIGILVDDAIVVVENLHRRSKAAADRIADAVDEVGGPTIVATFTVIAALLPMAFVSGLMGPYMRPIPINASMGMFISLIVAFTLTPWLFRHLVSRPALTTIDANTSHVGDPGAPRALVRLFSTLMSPLLRGRNGRGPRVLLLIGIVILISGSLLLAVNQWVVLKMLPFDNKSELQLVVDLPEGSTIEDTYRVLQSLANGIRKIPEVVDYQLYAGTSAPINFNGLVRQYYLRSQPHQGDIQVNLKPKEMRSRSSHDIALAARELLAPIASQQGASLKLVEVPPGPPVLAPLVAEINASEHQGLQRATAFVRQAFESQGIVDVDDSLTAAQRKLIVQVDRSRAASLGVSQQDVVATVHTALDGKDVSYLHDDNAKEPIPIRLELAESDKSNEALFGTIRVRSNNPSGGGALVPLSSLTQVLEVRAEQTIEHKDLVPVAYVTGDVAGTTDSPLYGLFAVAAALDESPLDDQTIQQFYVGAPMLPLLPSLKWDGEWQVTYETFRDMGIAYGVGLVAIYLLVVAQFKSYSVPLIIMAPIPLTIVGIMPGHALLDQPFTAPSMIGMIALAGIIVRNSILLVDFIQQAVKAGQNLQTATIEAAAVRARPIVLTALAAMLGAAFILDDPIFGGLAVSLLFGLLVSTLLTLVVIPVVYYAYHYPKVVEPPFSSV